MQTYWVCRYKYILVLTVLFVTVLYVNDILVYKLVDFFGITISAASLVFPITYVISDVVTEVYGYLISKKIIWLSVIFNFIFAVLIHTLVNTPPPPQWTGQNAYNIVLGNILVLPITYLLVTPIAAFVNTFLISKWKILVNGKYFLIRSMASSALGELIFSSLAVIIIWHFSPFENKLNIFDLVLVTFFSKAIWSIIGTIPASFVVIFLKSAENVDQYDIGINYNPFVLTDE